MEHTFGIPPDLQIIHSPIATVNVTDIDCTYIFNQDQNHRIIPAFTFQEFNFTDSTLTLQKTTSDGSFNKKPPIDFFPDGPSMHIQVKMNVPTKDSFSLAISYVDKVCSKYHKLESQEILYPFQSPPEVLNNGSIATECRWIFEHSDKNVKLGLNLIKNDFVSPLDIVSVNDGASETSPPLLQITTSNVNEIKQQLIRSTGPFLWVTFKPKTYASKFSANVTVHGQGGHFKESGQINVKPTVGNDTVFLLEVAENEIVLLNVTQSDFKAPAILNIYDGFDKTNLLANFQGNIWYPILSKTSKMMIIATGFSDSSLTATFKGVSPGCLHMSSFSDENYILSGNCNNTCMWIIPPQDRPGYVLLLNIQYLSLGKKDQLSIFKMDMAKTSLGEVSSNVTHIPQIIIPASVGALVEISRAPCEKENEDVVVVGHSSYLPVCGKDFSLSPRDKFLLTSPMYPDTYPILASCNWKINTAKENFVHYTFYSLQLAADHCIKITNSLTNKTEQYEGSNLPEDLLLTGSSVVEFDSINCKTSKVTGSLESAAGFVLNGTVADCGAVLSGKTSDEFSVVANKTICIWKVSVPATENNAVNIISYSVTKKDEIGNYEFHVYDGNSVRDSEIVNDTKSEIWSRTNDLIFIYKRCNSTMQCENKICLHPDWRCNGVNDCGDFSDEKSCEAVPIPQDITEEGYSSAAFWSTVFVMFFVGVALSLGIPFLYQKYKNERYHRFDDLSAIH
ncbi:CUB domain-containing protein [Caerostris extrusa]|uniref:CUB domain-containing protein n=1 Tax=Caerostris extrusa TaxID=172846 RepID=A0AAV4SJT8_CAEEX|nr:CUB domain-containing protein [Caerostris extrusa]